jgi:uncharacterized protein YjbI with pentapeptide repeats
MNFPQATAATPALPEIVKGHHFTTSQRGLRQIDMVYEDCHFDRVVWSECMLSKLFFINCRFEGNRFEHCDLSQLVCDRCEVTDARWDNCSIHGFAFSNGAIHGASWRGGGIKNAVFSHTQGNAWHFDTIRASHVSIVSSKADQLALRGGRWSDAAWIKADLADLTIADTEFANFIVGQSQCRAVSVHACAGINLRWIDCAIEQMQVRDCNLRQAAWSHSVWQNGAIEATQLPLVSFDHAQLSGITVRDSRMEQVIFDQARLRDCDLRNLQAPRAGLRHTHLERVCLSGANLPKLDARGAQLEAVALGGCDCRGGQLTGQPRQLWSEADTRHAIFDEPSAEDDRAWRQRTQPGVRSL